MIAAPRLTRKVSLKDLNFFHLEENFKTLTNGLGCFPLDNRPSHL